MINKPNDDIKVNRREFTECILAYNCLSEIFQGLGSGAMLFFNVTPIFLGKDFFEITVHKVFIQLQLPIKKGIYNVILEFHALLFHCWTGEFVQSVL